MCRMRYSEVKLCTFNERKCVLHMGHLFNVYLSNEVYLIRSTFHFLNSCKFNSVGSMWAI